jgi:hypothetical protein
MNDRTKASHGAGGAISRAPGRQVIQAIEADGIELCRKYSEATGRRGTNGSQGTAQRPFKNASGRIDLHHLAVHRRPARTGHNDRSGLRWQDSRNGGEDGESGHRYII